MSGIIRNLFIASYVGLGISSVANAQLNVSSGSGQKYSLSKLQVESSLDSLCRDDLTVFTDAWLYRTNTLTDVGFNERPGIVDIDESSLKYVFDNISPIFGNFLSAHARELSNDTITLYSIHPNSFIYGKCSPPNISDILNHAKFKTLAENFGLNYSSVIFDGFGRWSFDIDDKLCKSLTDTSKFKETLNTLDSSIKNYVRKNNILSNPYDKSLIRKYTGFMDSLGIYLEYIQDAR